MSLYDLAVKWNRRVGSLDIEATGRDPAVDRIIEISTTIADPDDPDHQETFCELIDPGVPIPPASTLIHGIRDSDVSTAIPFADVSELLAMLLDGVVIVGFGVRRFDVPILIAEIARTRSRCRFRPGPLIDSEIIYKQHERRNLSAAVRHYCGITLTTAHRANADADAAVLVLDAQLRAYAELGMLDAEQLDQASRWPEDRSR